MINDELRFIYGHLQTPLQAATGAQRLLPHKIVHLYLMEVATCFSFCS